MNAILLIMGMGMQEMLLIGLVILIFFGAKKIPEFMKGLGKGVREFKDGIKEVKRDAEDSTNSSPTTRSTTAKTKVEEERDLD